ncbi:MAG: PH domain-containing protein [Sphingobacteriales bacterium]|nr:PH domain-containing protein [Sphingobacteriales bacterium]
MKTYKSRIGIEFFVIFILAFIVPLYFVISEKNLGILLGSIFGVGFVFYIFFTTAYYIDEGKLLVKSGIFIYETIEIQSIHTIKATKSFFRAPAISPHRLAIYYNEKNIILVSPRNEQEFISDLKQVNPNMEVMV